MHGGPIWLWGALLSSDQNPHLNTIVLAGLKYHFLSISEVIFFQAHLKALNSYPKATGLPSRIRVFPIGSGDHCPTRQGVNALRQSPPMRFHQGLPELRMVEPHSSPADTKPDHQPRSLLTHFLVLASVPMMRHSPPLALNSPGPSHLSCAIPPYHAGNGLEA